MKWSEYIAKQRRWSSPAEDYEDKQILILCDRIDELTEALQSVVKIADRNTDEFNHARSVLKKEVPR